MRCPRCQHENRPQAKFCEECAAPLARACSNCSTPLSPTTKVCPECAHPVTNGATEPRFVSPESCTPKHLAEKILTSKGALEGERKQVTVLFADLKGSMGAVRRPRRGGAQAPRTANQVMGDGIMALFGAPLAPEDHAVRACYATLRMQESVKTYAEDVRRSHAAVVKIRVGLNAVEVRAIGSDLRAVGQTTHGRPDGAAGDLGQHSLAPNTSLGTFIYTLYRSPGAGTYRGVTRETWGGRWVTC